MLVSTDSFGAVQTLVRGWTPSANGVFPDRLQQARRQMAASFELKANGVAPSATGTDIFGAIARAAATMASEPSATRHTKDLYVFSDGVNETAGFQMPALLPTGVDNMMPIARANRLIVPLSGVHVYVFGATTANLNPETWPVTAKSADFSAELDEGDGLKNRRLRQCKISISEVLISVRLSLRGEVAERLKAAVAKGCRELWNGLEIVDFRPVFFFELGCRWLPNDRAWKQFGHSFGHRSSRPARPLLYFLKTTTSGE